MNLYSGLTPAQIERLALLSEECSEVIQIIAKIVRHGFESRNPTRPCMPNRHELEKEIGDVKVAVNLLCDAGDITTDQINLFAERKRLAVQNWLHHQEVA